MAAACVKLSILYFYRRIFVGRAFDLVAWLLIALSLLWTLCAFLAWILFCGKYVKENFEGSWVVCPSWGLYLQLAVYAWDTVIDFALLTLPMPLVGLALAGGGGAVCWVC